MDITISNLTKKFGEKIVFIDLSFTLLENSVTCIMGASGCGKTTLLNILMGIEAFDSGTIDGMSEKKISAVFQEDRLLENISAKSNIRFTCSKKISDKEIIDTMEKTGLEDCFHKPIREFSGGMKQRVAIVRALLSDYDILIMDEPLKGLDDETKDKVTKYIKSNIKNKTVIIVTHSLQEAENFSENIIKIDKLDK